MSNTKRIHRIVVDECHQTLVSSKFRPKLKAIDKLREVPLPKIYLSATLPPSHMDAFIQQVGIDSRSVKVVRAPTGRKELRYHNVGCRNSLAVHTLVQNLVLESYQKGVVQPDSRIIVFCSLVSDAVTTSEALGCLMYHGQMDPEERNKVQRTWMEGATPATRCIAATSAFVHGIDAPYVDLIVFINPPYGAIDFVQASSRGGRRGRPAMVVLVHHSTTLTVEKPDYGMHAVMNAYVINQRKCRRAILTSAMDGDEVKCSISHGDELCDICCPDTEMTRLIKSCSRIGHLPAKGCLKALSDHPVDKIEVKDGEDDDDAHLYEGIDDSALAAFEMPNSLEVRQVSIYTLGITCPAV